jgi:hypothetical protein
MSGRRGKTREDTLEKKRRVGGRVGQVEEGDVGEGEGGVEEGSGSERREAGDAEGGESDEESARKEDGSERPSADTQKPTGHERKKRGRPKGSGTGSYKKRDMREAIHGSGLLALGECPSLSICKCAIPVS